MLDGPELAKVDGAVVRGQEVQRRSTWTGPCPIQHDRETLVIGTDKLVQFIEPEGREGGGKNQQQQIDNEVDRNSFSLGHLWARTLRPSFASIVNPEKQRVTL